jgi:hypothetical protein
MFSILRFAARKNSYFMAAILGGAFITEYMVDQGVEKFYAWYNCGVHMFVLKCLEIVEGCAS